MSGQNRNTATEDGEAGDGEVSGEYTLLYIKGGVGMWRAFPLRRRCSRSTIKINVDLFCIVLTKSYFCSRKLEKV